MLTSVFVSFATAQAHENKLVLGCGSNVIDHIYNVKGAAHYIYIPYIYSRLLSSSVNSRSYWHYNQKLCVCLCMHYYLYCMTAVVPASGGKGFFLRYNPALFSVRLLSLLPMIYSPFKALESKLIGGVTLNHLAWAALGGGTMLVSGLFKCFYI